MPVATELRTTHALRLVYKYLHSRFSLVTKTVKNLQRLPKALENRRIQKRLTRRDFREVDDISPTQPPYSLPASWNDGNACAHVFQFTPYLGLLSSLVFELDKAPCFTDLPVSRSDTSYQRSVCRRCLLLPIVLGRQLYCCMRYVCSCSSDGVTRWCL